MRNSRFRPWHVVTASLFYWLVLFLANLWRPLSTYWSVTHTPGGHGSASFDFAGNPATIALWIFGPPVALCAGWLILRRAYPASAQEGSDRVLQFPGFSARRSFGDQTMLTSNDEQEIVNRRIADALWQSQDSRARVLRRDHPKRFEANEVRPLMETAGRAGTIRPLRRDGRAAFVYICFNERGRPFAQGLGDSPERAVLDAFLEWAGQSASLVPR